MQCPQCGYQQSRDDTCLQCGIVFPKYFEIQERKRRKAQAREQVHRPAQNREPTDFLEFDEVAEHRPSATAITAGAIWEESSISETSGTDWSPVSSPAFIGLSLGFAFLLYLLAAYDLVGGEKRSTLLWMLHNVNLVFHEAGHPIFGMFGNETLGILGGTLGQLLVPLAVAISFWLRRETAGFAFGMFWFFENFLDVAVYMADARVLQLQLIGGLGMESHDWRNLFNIWDLWTVDITIANTTRNLGWLGMIATWLWLSWRWWQSRDTNHS